MVQKLSQLVNSGIGETFQQGAGEGGGENNFSVQLKAIIKTYLGTVKKRAQHFN